MQKFGLGPAEFDDLHRWDKSALRYYMIVSSHYEQLAIERAKTETEKKSRFSQNLPKLRR